jgi:hypothetical protein
MGAGNSREKGITYLRFWIIKSAGEPGLLDHCHQKPNDPFPLEPSDRLLRVRPSQVRASSSPECHNRYARRWPISDRYGADPENS